MLEPRSAISFILTRGQSAVLLTKYPIYREDAQLGGTFEEYTKEHFDSWVTFARQRGHPKDIEPVLVTGVDLTRDFAMMSCSNGNRDLEVNFTISEPTVAPPWGVWTKPGNVHVTCGPQSRRLPPAARTVSSASSDNARPVAVSNQYNQCVFVRYYTVRRKLLGIPRVIKASAGPHDLGSGDRNDGRSPLVAQSNSGSDTALSPFDDDGDGGGGSVTSAGYGSDDVIHNTPAVHSSISAHSSLV